MGVGGRVRDAAGLKAGGTPVSSVCVLQGVCTARAQPSVPAFTARTTSQQPRAHQQRSVACACGCRWVTAPSLGNHGALIFSSPS